MLVRPMHQMHPGEQQKQTGVGYGRQLFVSQHRDTGRERERGRGQVVLLWVRWPLTGRAPNPVDWKKTCAHARGKVCEFHLSVTLYLIAPLNI